MGIRGHVLLMMMLIVAAAQFCAVAQTCCTATEWSHDYAPALASDKSQKLSFNDLPGFTRSTYKRDHALITPESRVWAGFPGWMGTVTAHLISPASGASFSMYLANMSKDANAGPPAAATVERFVVVLQGEARAVDEAGNVVALPANTYAYFPPNSTVQLSSIGGCGLLIYERVYSLKGTPVFQHGVLDESPLIPVPGESFVLRKLLPQTSEYDFNIHIMDFQPGEYLFVKEIHYNQHGLLMLEGKGIYRLAENWYPVQAGDAVWMAPFVVQWYAALGTTPTRYVILKDTTVDPLLS